eukprot:GGOE01036403.1.p1 GENE.GGOE01036403.1~~GGOE01036403.1.p1  ORF type:complete len:423 (+),score=128.00 GGOE01036403.1:25-1269(+)
MEDPIPELVDEQNVVALDEEGNIVDTELGYDGASIENQDGDEYEELDHDAVEELSQTSEEIREEMVHELEVFEFPEEMQAEDDATGRLAYKQKCAEFDFYMFPVDSVLQKFDAEALLLAHCGLGDKGAIALAEALKVNTTVVELSVVDNWITPVGAQPLIEAIKTSPCIAKVDLSENRLGYRASVVGGPSIGDSLKDLIVQNSTIRSIALRSNKLGDGDVTQVADGLCENFTLHRIDLSYNELGPRAGEAIASMLSTNGDLAELNLDWNQFRQDGAMKVLDGLKQNNVLKRISLAWTGMTDRCGVALGEILTNNTSLEEVDVSHNRIGYGGAKKIADGLADNATIRWLALSHNPLGDEGCSGILVAIGVNQSLTFIDLQATDSGPLSAEAYTEAAQKRRDKVQIVLSSALVIPK